MSDATVRGTVHLIEETKTYGQKGFRKRLVVLEQDKGRFINYIPVDFVHDGCDAVDELSVGDDVEVTYRLSGRKWQRDERSEVKFFLNAEATEFKKIYDLEVVVIPTNKDMVRRDFPDVIYKTRREKFAAVVEEIGELHHEGQPVLVGTVSIDVSEALAQQLKKKGIRH